MRITLCIAVLAVALSARTATANTCSVAQQEVSYDKPTFISASSTDTRCDFAVGMCTKIELKGYLYTPTAAFTGARPLVVFHHGNTDNPGEQCGVAEWFVGKGYVVFVPHRRGAGMSTGTRISVMQQNTSVDFLAYTHEHALDVISSVKYARALLRTDGTPWVDQSRVATIGHSMGAEVVMFANETDMAQRAVIAISPGPAAWSVTEVQNDLISAIQNAVRPVFVLQPLDDITTQPTIVLQEKAGEAFMVHQSALFPKVCTPSSAPGCSAHNTFPSAKVDSWGPTAIEFIERNAP
jgi:dienelactone hydrolase